VNLPLGPVLPQEDPRQSLRVRRFLMAALVYLLAILLLALYVRQGLLALHEWRFAALVILLVNGALFALLRSGRNERFADPSLTGIQMIVVCLVMGMTMYLLDGGRGGMLLLFLVLLMFGVLRLNARQFTALGGFALFCYATAIAAVWQQRPEAFNPQVEFLHLAALSTLVPCGGFFASHVSSLRRALRERQIDLQRALEEVHDLRSLDPLTGISNRSATIAFLTQEMQRAERLDQPLSVIMIDLVRFKRVNREYGHPAGDEVLQGVAERLRRGVRDIDGLGRYGGEEFLVVLPDTPEDEANRVASQLQDAIQNGRFPGLPVQFSVQCAIGVGERVAGDDVWQLIERARGESEVGSG
jgi:diguanylate cyclase (GGDEF)-like protein